MSGMATTTMMERFHQLELDKNFIFVGAIGTGRQAESFTVKCKSCNTSRRVWIDVLKGKAKGFRCKVCGQSTEGALVSEVKTFYKNGNTKQATAEAFGMTQNQIRWLATRFHWDSPLNNANRSGNAESVYIQWLDDNGFEYVGGFTSADKSFTAKCKNCGTVKTKCWREDKMRRGVPFCNVCNKREKAEVRKQESEAKAAEFAKLREERKERDRIERLMMPEVSAYRQSNYKKMNIIHTCKLCKTPYTIASYMASAGIKYFRDSGVCSKECLKRASKYKAKHKSQKTENHRKRARKYGVPYEPGITLEKLVKRDGLTCRLCGEECDWEDKQWGYSGPLYPSMDHFIPMARGGGHVWSNVQVAHVLCNSIKGDTLPELINLEDEDVREVTA